MSSLDNACAECGGAVGGPHAGTCSKWRASKDRPVPAPVTIEDTSAWLADRAAVEGAGDDAIDRAVAYMRHILEREVEAHGGELPITHALVVVEGGYGQKARTTFAASDHDMTRTQVQGMFYDCLRALAMVFFEAEGPKLPPPRPDWRDRLARFLDKTRR